MLAAVRYALAPACIGVAVLLHVSPAGPYLHPTGLLLLGVAGTAWFGGLGPALLAALLATLVLPRLMPMSYPLLADLLDLPHLIIFSIAGAVVGWGTRRRLAERKRVEQKLDAGRRAEDALRLSEERYALALEASEEGHFDTDLEKDETFVSARLNEILGLPRRAETVNRLEYLKRIPVHPDDRHLIAELMKPVLEDDGQDVYEFEFRIVPRPGEIRWIHTRGKVVRDAEGHARRRVGMVADITERKRAEEALRLSEERYALAVAGASDGIWDEDLTTGMLYRSPRNQEMALGRPSDGIDVRPRAEWAQWHHVHPDDAPKRDAARRAHIEGRTPLYEIEYRVRHPDGSYHWIHARGVCTRDASGRALRFVGSTSDIDARKRAEEGLRLSEQRLAVALETAEEGNWDWNPQTDEIWASPQSLKVLGIPQDTVHRSRSGQLALVRLHPADKAGVADEWRAALAGRDVEHEFEYRILRGEPAEPRWIRSRWKIFRDDAGVAVRVIGIVADITERKLALDTITESEARFRSVIDFAPVAIALTNARSSTSGPRILQVNQEFTRMFGYAPEEIVGKEVGTLAPGDLRDAYLANVGSLDSGNKVEKEGVRQRKDGSRILVHLTGVPIRLRDETTFALLMYRDLTERERATQALRESEEALRISEERYAFAMEAAQDAHWDWIIDTDKYYTSPRVVDVLGFPPGTTFASRQDYLARTPLLREDLEVWHRKVRELFAGSGSRLSMDLRAIINGEVRWIQHHGLCVRDASGRAVRWCGTVRDTTERRRAEEALRQAQRLESLGTMAGGIAHDFNNILGVIVGYGEMALRGAKKDARLRRDLDAIMSAGERGRALVDRILAFSRSGVGERVPVHVEEVVREALEQLAAKLPGNVTIAPRLRAGRAAMLGDSTQVHQVVMNLANNAAQAMPDGGAVRVTLEAARLEAARSATVGAVALGEYIVLQVSDAGTGIAPEVLERMFDPFFTTKEVGVGSGLGLSLVHGIVANVGGAIDVATELGKGSTFTVYLPRSGDAPAKVVQDERPLPRGEGQRVLVVDDEEQLVRLAAETLEGLGYAPVPFTSGTAALAAFRADPQRFDAVLTDERMPGITGTALIREVRGIRDAIPVVLMSGYLGMEAPAASVVVRKPLSAGELAASLARALHP